jgi:hypothetical protein
MVQAAHTVGGGLPGDGLQCEFDDLVNSLENDTEVQRQLDSLPLPSASDGAVISYRDIEDVDTIRRLSWAVIILLALCFSLGGALIYKMLMKPIMIVQDRTSGETLVIDGRQYGGKTSTLEVGPEELTDRGKISLATNFLEKLYNIDPATRGADMNKAVRMMDPDGSIIYSRWLKEKQVLETQAAEGWQATWHLQDMSIDERDPYIVRALGEQVIRRKVNGELKQETRQVSVKLLLTVSTTKPKRNDNNLNTGFCISKFKAKSLNEKDTSTAVLMSEADGQ